MIREIREQITNLLLSTERDGIEFIVGWMEDNGFFTSPCSSENHLAKDGGLAEHSLNVLDYMDDIYSGGKLDEDVAISRDSMIICALLHDLGKCGDHGKDGYVPNMVKDGRPTKADQEQKYKRSESKPYKTNPELMYIPHEVRSVAIAERFITLTEEEEFAILYHNGLYGDFRYAVQGKETPLYLLLHFADMWSSRVFEKKFE